MSKERGSRAFQNARLKKQQKKESAAADGRFAQAVALHQRGLIPAAQAAYREILQKAPTHFDTLYFLGVSEFQSGRFDEADRLLREALTVRPQSADACSTHAAILYELGRFDEALAGCDRALKIKPDADTFNIRGNALTGLQRFEDAIASFDKAITLKPDFVGALSNRGNALKELTRFDEALASFDKAIAINPHFAEAFSNRGNVLKDLMRFDDALASYERAVAIRPDYADAHNNRGMALLELLRTDEALASFDKALAIKPDFAEAHNGRGDALKELLRFEEALASFDKAVAARPDFAEAHSNRGTLLMSLTRFDEALASFDRALAIKPDFSLAFSNKIFCLDFTSDTGFETQQAARKDWWGRIGSKIAAGSNPSHDNVRNPARRLVLGYVSSDFKRHSAATIFKPVLQNHDKSKFELVCYSCSIAEDDATEEFKRIANVWHQASHWPDERLAEQIRKDKVDILIDLSGHSAGNRLGVFARKPAPIQVTAWGHAAGTGLPTIDYLLSDPVTIPAASRHLFAEKIYDLPCLVTLDQLPDGLHVADPPLLSKKFVTFGVFNRVSKISDDAIGIWARILQATSQSRLLIKDVALGSESIRHQLTEKFAAHGIAADRIGLLGRTTREDHLRAFKDVDIGLDPFPVGGGVSTMEALAMGVPVVAMLGDGVSARLAGAIVSSIGLQDWAAQNVEDYFATAVKFAAQPELIAALRRELPDRLAKSATGNNVIYTNLVEDAYRSMWETYCRRAS